MTTKTFHDIYDLVELVNMMENASIEIHLHDGQMSFEITNFTKDAAGLTESSQPVTIDGSLTIRGYCENIDKAWHIVADKLNSGEWKKNDDCA